MDRSRALRLLKNRVCVWCGHSVEPTNGVVTLDLPALTCLGECTEALRVKRRAYDRSDRGRWRSRREIWDILESRTRIWTDPAGVRHWVDHEGYCRAHERAWLTPTEAE